LLYRSGVTRQKRESSVIFGVRHHTPSSLAYLTQPQNHTTLNSRGWRPTQRLSLRWTIRHGADSGSYKPAVNPTFLGVEMVKN